MSQLATNLSPNRQLHIPIAGRLLFLLFISATLSICVVVPLLPLVPRGA